MIKEYFHSLFSQYLQKNAYIIDSAGGKDLQPVVCVFV